MDWGQTTRDFTPTDKGSFTSISLEDSAEFKTTKDFCKTAFDMGKIKKEEARYQELPKIYAFKSQSDKEIILNRNFARVNSEIDQPIETILGASKKSE